MGTVNKVTPNKCAVLYRQPEVHVCCSSVNILWGFLKDKMLLMPNPTSCLTLRTNYVRLLLLGRLSYF